MGTNLGPHAGPGGVRLKQVPQLSLINYTELVCRGTVINIQYNRVIALNWQGDERKYYSN